MDSSSQAANYLAAMEIESDDIPSGMMPTDDQCFLLYFVMGTYFGPDLKGCGPPKSVLQRVAEGLLPYDHHQLAGSYMKMVDIERIYYYVLKNADESVVAKLPILHQFLKGNLPNSDQSPAAFYPQFPDLFPVQLHPHSQIKNQDNVVENIVFVNNPEALFMKPEDINRFKRLAQLEDIILDRDALSLQTLMAGGDLYNVSVQGEEFNCDLPSLGVSRISQRKRHANDIPDSENPQFVTPVSSMPVNDIPMTLNSAPLPDEMENRSAQKHGPAMIFLPSQPSGDEWDNIMAATKTGFALTGSATMGQVGPLIGLMDIGECEDSYLFRVSLPGVKRDEREFSCAVESDGKVLIRGVTTTGEKTVRRFAQMFEMQTQNLCPPGQFSLSFQMPGPINPQQFSANYGTDGILEGIVMKADKQCKN
ncbi:increased DNA methylation 2-like [Malania oleifera]|uniref:increased DNA methylation 2-like n=1 Tax=Malania oleifera TaxID=397392 RepID=UPI0025AE3900|nr:increased DNA methylation 2-like [Malania oleifera]